jgi:hypothetical protein
VVTAKARSGAEPMRVWATGAPGAITSVTGAPPLPAAAWASRHHRADT